LRLVGRGAPKGNSSIHLEHLLAAVGWVGDISAIGGVNDEVEYLQRD